MALQLLGEAALSGLFQTLFQGLSPIFLKGLSLISGVNQDQLEILKHDLLRIQDVLNDAERRRTTEKSVSNWLDDLRDLAYDMEDIIDEMNTEQIRMEVHDKKLSENDLQVSSFLSTLRDKYGEVKFNEEIKSKIEEAIERFSMVAKRADALGLRREVLVGTSFVRQQRGPSVDRSEVYGRDQDQENVIKLLLVENGSKKNYDIIIIVGTGGIGKTTLAQLVFNDQQIRSNFDGLSWACVSDVFDVAKVTGDLLEYYTVNSCSLTSLPALQFQLENMLKDKKFFLVLDDVWTTKEWDIMKGPLSQCGKGSKILITTRSRTVAKAISKREPYEVGALDEAHSWTLFRERAFVDGEENIDERLVDIGKKIVKKCGGFPLAIKVIGAILQDATADKWESILNSELWESLGSDDEIFPALRLSYHVLPSHLKRCFEYLSLFPTDFQLFTRKLVPMWIAEGLIEAEKGRLAEDVGNEYYNDLQNRCLIQMDGRMHDLVHSLACLVSGNFHCRVTKSSQVFTSARRYSFSGTGVEQYGVNSISKAKGIRTLLVFKCKLLPLVDQFSEWKFLRVLDLSDSGLMDLPNSIGDLRSLRYLNLSNNKSISHLPNAICNLYNLQVLLLRGCCSLERMPDGIGDLLNLESMDLSRAPISTLPDSICQLARLEKLWIKYCKNLTHLPKEIGSLTSLRLLSLRELQVNELPESMCHLPQLQKLNISNCKNLVHLPNDLGNLSNLRILRCRHTQVNELPESMFHLHQLQELNISGCKNLVHLPNDLGNLSNLRILRCGFTQVNELPESMCHLHKLQELNISGCKNLVHLPNDLGNLSNLRILRCRRTQVNELPESMCHLHQLQVLDISSCKNLVHLPNDLGNLTNLQILRCPSTQLTLPDSISSICSLQELWTEEHFSINRVKLPRHIGRLTNIQHLDGYHVGKDEGRGIGELRYLNKIKGRLRIANLDNISREEATMADLKSKKYVTELILKWSDIPITGDIERDKELEVEILQALQPHATSLIHLSLENYFGDRFPKWILDGGQLPSLKSLALHCLNNINRIDIKFPSLDYLSVTNCPNLKEISIVALNLGSLTLKSLLSLTSLTDYLKFSDPTQLAALQDLMIEGCERLTSLGIESSALPKLRNLRIVSCGNLERILKDGRLPFTLNRLSCVDCPHLNSITDDQGMQDLTSLVDLHVDYSKNMEMELQAGRLPSNLNALTIDGRRTDIISMPPSCFCNVASSLESLTISDFPNLTSLPNSLQDMGSLQTFYLIKCPQFVSFPNEGLPPLLRYLTIRQCDKLLFLPTNIYHLQRLHGIYIVDCSLLQARVDDQLPPNLQYLTIRRCPKLENQLQEEDRKDWLWLIPF